MANNTKGKLRTVFYQAIEKLTGITDFVVVITKPDNTALSPTPTVSEVGNGVYKFSYTPPIEGVYIEKISSVSNEDNETRTIEIENMI